MPEIPTTYDDASVRAAQLRSEIEYHAHRYYALDRPEITDAAYDSLVHELEAIEATYPALVTADSPTQRVGEAPSSQFASVAHASRMYSLDNAMDLDELDAWPRARSRRARRSLVRARVRAQDRRQLARAHLRSGDPGPCGHPRRRAQWRGRDRQHPDRSRRSAAVVADYGGARPGRAG